MFSVAVFSDSDAGIRNAAARYFAVHPINIFVRNRLLQSRASIANQIVVK